MNLRRGSDFSLAVMRVLVSLDESECSERVVRYAAAVLRDHRRADVTLFHVLRPLPRQLLEHGGSENPTVEQQLSEQLRREQEAWSQREQEAECPILLQGREILIKEGFDPARIRLKFGHEEDVGRAILEEARSGRHDTIVLGRRGMSRIKRLLIGGITERVLREAQGLTVWVVE